MLEVNEATVVKPSSSPTKARISCNTAKSSLIVVEKRKRRNETVVG